MGEKKNNLRIFERFASPNEKLIFKTLKDLYEKAKITTTGAIASVLKKNQRKNNEYKLNAILTRLEEYKLIQINIKNVKDTPILIWKP